MSFIITREPYIDPALLCGELYEKLNSLYLIRDELQSLKDHLLQEGPSSVVEVKKAFIEKKAEVKKVQEELEHLLQQLEQEKKETLELIKQRLQEFGSPATLDESFEGGIIHLTVPDDLKAKLNNWDSLTQAYKDADTTQTYVNEDLSGISLTVPIPSSLDVIVLNHGQTTEAQRDKLVEDMDKAGYRPLHFQELVAFGILRPNLNKRDEVLNTYEKHRLGGYVQSPFLRWEDGNRWLGAYITSRAWEVKDRFLFVRK